MDSNDLKDHRVYNTEALEEIPLKASIVRQNSYWQVIGFEGQSQINQDTAHTWDVLYKHLQTHFINLLRKRFGYRFDLHLETKVEVVEGDAAYHRRGEKISIQPDLLPRLIFTQKHDLDQEALVNIPSMDQTNLFKKKPRFTLAILNHKKDPNDGLMYTYMRDVSIAVTGDYRYKPMGFAFTVMVNNTAESMEIASMLKSEFPVGVNNDIYWDYAPIVGTKLEMVEPVAYDLEVIMPRQVENTLKKILGINQKGETSDRTVIRPSDDKLLKMLRSFSETPVDLKLIGGKNEIYFVFRYKSQVTITTTSIVEDVVRTNNIAISAVKINFIVNYIEVTRFGIHSELTRVNPDSKLIHTPEEVQEANPDMRLIYKDINMVNWHDNIEGTTKEATYEIKVDNSFFVDDENYNKYCKFNFMEVLPIPNLIKGFMKRSKMRHGKTEIKPGVTKDRLFYNIVVIRKKVRKGIDDHEYVGTSPGVEIDYNKDEVIDKIIELNEEFIVALYINKAELHTYLERVGYYSDPNLARDYSFPKLEE